MHLKYKYMVSVNIHFILTLMYERQNGVQKCIIFVYHDISSILLHILDGAVFCRLRDMFPRNVAIT